MKTKFWVAIAILFVFSSFAQQVPDPRVISKVEADINAIIRNDSIDKQSDQLRAMNDLVRGIVRVFEPKKVPQRFFDRLQEIYEKLLVSPLAKKGVTFYAFRHKGSHNKFPSISLGRDVFILSDLVLNELTENSEDEGILAALVAHELGHDDRDFRRRSLILGNDLPQDWKDALLTRIEVRADWEAMLLLHSAGLKPSYMLRTLYRLKVANPDLKDLDQRITMAEKAVRDLTVTIVSGK